MNCTTKICCVTGSRAEFGLLKRLLMLIDRSQCLTLQLLVTGTHLSTEHGDTIEEIDSEIFRIDRKIDINLICDTSIGVSKSTASCLVGCAEAFNDLRPDIVLILGDRFEILAAATAAMLARIPIAHIHGGEITEGAIDDAIRHSITKMAHIHFVATEEYRARVIQMGEQPNAVWNVGSLGVDAIKNIKLLTKSELSNEIGVQFERHSLLIAFHPVTLDPTYSKNQIKEILLALDTLTETTLIFTLPNADPENSVVRSLIETFVDEHQNAHQFISLGQRLFLSCAYHVDCVLGNSSSGVIEIPSLKKPTINIGNRQKGRLMSPSVIDVVGEKNEIIRAINRAQSPEFLEIVENSENSYGVAGAADQIMRVLRSLDTKSLLKKQFHDANF